MRRLDRVDLKLLELLQRDSDTPIAALSEQVNLSQNACWRRIKLLEEHGYITRRAALLNAAAFGLRLTVFAFVRTNEHSETWLEKFSAGVRAIPEIVEFYRLSGDVDYLLKILVSDVADYDRVYKKLISVAPLTDVSSAFAMENIKVTTEIPLPAPSADGKVEVSEDG